MQPCYQLEAVLFANQYSCQQHGERTLINAACQQCGIHITVLKPSCWLTCHKLAFGVLSQSHLSYKRIHATFSMASTGQDLFIRLLKFPGTNPTREISTFNGCRWMLKNSFWLKLLIRKQKGCTVGSSTTASSAVGYIISSHSRHPSLWLTACMARTGHSFIMQ
jgi:hypothetical protein